MSQAKKKDVSKKMPKDMDKEWMFVPFLPPVPFFLMGFNMPFMLHNDGLFEQFDKMNFEKLFEKYKDFKPEDMMEPLMDFVGMFFDQSRIDYFYEE